MERKPRCSLCGGRGWTLNDRNEPTPCKCRVEDKEE